VADRQREPVTVWVREPRLGGLRRVTLKLVEVDGGEDVRYPESLPEIAVPERLDHLDDAAADGQGALAKFCNLGAWGDGQWLVSRR